MHISLHKMPRTVCALLLLMPAWLFAAGPPKAAADSEPARSRQTAVIELLTGSWHWGAAQPAHSTLTAQALEAQFAAPADRASGFTVKLKAELKKLGRDTTILEIPEV